MDDWWETGIFWRKSALVERFNVVVAACFLSRMKLSLFCIRDENMPFNCDAQICKRAEGKEGAEVPSLLPLRVSPLRSLC